MTDWWTEGPAFATAAGLSGGIVGPICTRVATLVCELLAALFCAATPAVADSRKVEYQFVDLGSRTGIVAINDSGEVAGYNVDDGSSFLREPDGTVVSFTVSGACTTIPSGINERGLIVGTADMGDGCYGPLTRVGFLRARDGTVTTFPGLQGWKQIGPDSVDTKGAVVGLYFEVNGPQWPFIRRPDGVLRRYKALGDARVFSIALNDKGAITGSYRDDRLHGFVQATDGTLTMFSAPDGTDILPIAINRDGWIVGMCGAGLTQSFVRDPLGTVILLGRNLYADSINRSGAISGRWGGGGKSAFVRSSDGKLVKIPSPGQYDRIQSAYINQDEVLAGTLTRGSSATEHGFVAYPQRARNAHTTLH